MTITDPRALHDRFADALGRGDVDGLLALYERGAVQLQADGSVSADPAAVRAVFEGVVAGPPLPPTTQRLTIAAEDLALTSTAYRLEGAGITMTTAEVSRRQPDGTWLVVIDAPGFVVQPV